MTSMALPIASTSIKAPDAAKWPARRIVVFHGQHDTRIATGEDYASMSLADIFGMAPSDVDKRSSPACIPSTYLDHDAREHARQRQVGQFVALCGDVDTGNHPLERITDAVRAFAAGAAWLVYSSAHARDGDMRWRIIIPLSEPLPFARWHDVQSVFFATMEDAGIMMDHALARAAQPVYLPNVPAIHAKSGAALRGADGRPIYYRRATSGMEAPGLDTSLGPVANGILALVSKREADERERKRIREIAEQRRANRPASDSAAIIDGFNASNGVAAMLESCGYAQSPRDGRDWRSPMQTGETFATRVIEGKWVSLSASDVAAGVGTACASGCYGDAYDLFVHFKHGGDHKAAFRQLHSERRDEIGAKIIRGRFPPEPPPVDASDPGWQGMPEWANQTPSYADVGGMPEDGQAIDPAPLRGANKPKSEPVTVTATPYVWRDPATIKPREWVYGRSIQRGHVRAILAPGAAGKTILSIGEALAMATGRNLLGQHVPDGPKRVWLWNLEDDGDELARIIQAACKHWSIGPEDIRDKLFVDSALEGAILKLATSTAAEGLVINRPLVAALTDEMLGRGIDYLHVDPFVSSHAANENDNMEIDAIAKEWALVAKNAKAGIGLAHHVSKAGAAEVTALSGRGAVSLINACRSVMVLNRMGEDEAKRWGIEDERRRRFFRVYDDKNNRAPPSDKSDWYTMASVSLGNGVNDDGDNMGVVIPWSPPNAFENVGADHLRRVQALVEAGSYKESAQATEWVGKAVADVLGISADKAAIADRAKINGILRVWYANGALVVVERRDPDKREMKKFVEVGIPAIDDAPPVASGAGQGGADGAPKAPRPTCPPIGAGVGRLVLARDSKVGRGSTPEGQVPHGNPALKPILAAGETGDEPIPGWEDL